MRVGMCTDVLLMRRSKIPQIWTRDSQHPLLCSPPQTSTPSNAGPQHSSYHPLLLETRGCEGWGSAVESAADACMSLSRGLDCGVLERLLTAVARYISVPTAAIAIY